MNCPGCHSFDLDPSTQTCGGCGYYLTARREQELRSQMVVPRRAVEEAREEMALREGGG